MPDLPSGLFFWVIMMKEQIAKGATHENRASQEIKPDQDSGKIVFLGIEYTPDVYREIVGNLAEYFNILKSWKEKENRLEKEEDI